jgi:hypothetical protein
VKSKESSNKENRVKEPTKKSVLDVSDWHPDAIVFAKYLNNLKSDISKNKILEL